MSDLTLRLRILADASGLTRETERARLDLLNLASTAEGIGRQGLYVFGGAAAAATVALTEFSTQLESTATFAGYAAGIAIGTTRTLMFAKELEGLSAATAMSVQDLRAWQLAGGQFGVSAEDVSKTIGELSAAIAEMQSVGGDSKLAQSLSKIGISIAEVRGMNPDELLGTVVTRLDQIQGLSVPQKNMLLEEIASGASKLSPLLRDNAAAFAEIRKHAELVGAIITPEQEKVLEAANGQLSEMRVALEGVSNTFGHVGAEIISTFGDSFNAMLDKEAVALKAWSTDAIKEVHRLFEVFQNAGGFDGGGIRAIYEDMFPDLSAFTTGLGQFVDGFVDAVMEVWDVVQAAFSPIIDLLNAITGSSEDTLESIGALAGYIGGTTATIMAASVAYGLTAGALGTLGVAATAAAAALGVAGRAVQVLTLLLAANPIGAVVAAAAAAAGAMYYFAEANNEAARTIELANGQTLAFGEVLDHVTDLSNEYRTASTERQNAIREEIDNIIKLTNQRKIEAQQQLDYLNQLDAESADAGAGSPTAFANSVIKWGSDIFGLDQGEAKAVIKESTQITDALTQKQNDLGKSTAQLAQEQKDKAKAEAEAAGVTFQATEATNKSGIALQGASKAHVEAAKVIHEHGDAMKSLIEGLTKQRVELEHGKLAAEYYANRLNGLSDAEARAAAGAGQYNALLAERKKLNREAEELGGGLRTKYQNTLEDQGLSADSMTGIDAAQVAADRSIAAADKYRSSIESTTAALKQQADAQNEANKAATGSFVSSASNGSVSVKSGGGVASSKEAAKVAKAAAAHPQVISIIDKVARETGVNPSVMKTMAYIESKFNDKAYNPSSASGVYQLVNRTAGAYGLSGKQFDAESNTRAYTKLLADNSKMLKSFGIEVTGANLYLAHQQGAGGLAEIRREAAGGKRASDTVHRNMRGNPSGGGNDSTAAGFLKGWTDHYNNLEATVMGTLGGTKQLATEAEKIPVSAEKAIPSWESIAATATAAKDVTIEYGGAIDGARASQADIASLADQYMSNQAQALINTAADHAKQVQLTGAEYRNWQLSQQEFNDGEREKILLAEQLAAYATEANTLEEEHADIRAGMAEQYQRQLEKQNLTQEQIASLVAEKMAIGAEKLTYEASKQTDELHYTAEAWREIQLEQDGYNRAQIASITGAEELLERTKAIRDATDKIGDGMFDALTKMGDSGMIDGLKSTVENAFKDMILTPTIKPITDAISVGMSNTISGQANPWAGLQRQYAQTMGSIGAGGVSGAMTAAGVGASIGGLTGSQEGSIGGAIGGAAGSAIGMALGGPIGAKIGSVIGSVAGGLIGDSFKDDDSARAKFTNGNPTDGFVNRDGNKLSATSVYGSFGFQEDGTHDLGNSAEKEMAAFVARMAEIDNALASFIPASETARIKAELAGFEHTGLDFADLFKQRLVVITSGLSETMRGLIDYSKDADGILARINDLIAIQKEAVPALRNMNMQIGATDDAALSAAAGLADAAGGLQNLTSIASAYYAAVYSEDEQKQSSIRTAQAAVDAFNAANNAQINSLSGLRRYVEGLDVTNPAAQQASLAAMGLADELQLLAGSAAGAAANVSDLDSANAKLADQQAVFSLFNNELDKITSGLDDQLNALESSYRDQIAAFEQAQDAADSLRDALRGLKSGDLTTLTPEKQLAAARAEFEKLQKAAKGGDVEAAKNLESAGETLLRLSREYNASSTDYSADFDRVSNGWESVAAILENQQDPQQDLLDAQNHLIDQAASQAAQMAAVYGGIIGGNTLLELMGGNINKLPPAIAASLNAILKDLKAPDIPTTPILQIKDYKALAEKELSKLTDPKTQIASLYPLLLNKAGDTPGIDYWSNELKKGEKLEDVIARFIDGAIADGTWAKVHPNSHATGLYSVPYDNYSANLHAGEAVVDAASMNAMRKYGIPLQSKASGNNIVVNVDMQALVAKVEALTSEVRSLRSERSQDAQTAQQQRNSHIKQSGNTERGVIRAVKMRGGK